jgi:hypothetical protein
MAGAAEYKKPAGPLWRQGYDAIERALEPQLNAVLGHDRFGQAVGVGVHVHQSARDLASSSTRRLLHALNLPAGTDVTRILNEIGSLKRQLYELSTQLEREDLRRSPALLESGAVDDARA